VTLTTRVPALELLDTHRRSGIGRLLKRPDLAALAVVFTFGALVNAFAMTAPASHLEFRLAALLHIRSEALVLGLVFVMALMVMPAGMLGLSAILTRLLSREPAISLATTALRFAFALVPFGLGVWLSWANRSGDGQDCSRAPSIPSNSGSCCSAPWDRLRS
jgi:hypothetical protein